MMSLTDAHTAYLYNCSIYTNIGSNAYTLIEYEKKTENCKTFRDSTDKTDFGYKPKHYM